MKFLPLVWSALVRRKIRTLFTALSIFVAFVLFGLMMAIRAAFAYGVELSGADRLMMFHKVSIAQPLPLAYQTQIAAVPGVDLVAHATWFGGIYQHPRNFFVQLAIDPAYLDMHREFIVPVEGRKAWLANRRGCIVGRDLAARFGWEVGDRIPLQGTSAWHKADGSAWEFIVDAIYEPGVRGTSLTQMFLHYEYVNEAQSTGRDYVGWYQIRVSDPPRAADVAAALDARFANSAFETKTATETAFLQAYASQIGDIGTIMAGILSTVLFTILLVVGNTIAQSVRERTTELAVLKTLGFTNSRILGLVLVESLTFATVAGSLGLASAWMLVGRGDPTGGLLPTFYLPSRDLLIGGALAVALGVVTGVLPAGQAVRLRIVDALRHAA